MKNASFLPLFLTLFLSTPVLAESKVCKRLDDIRDEFNNKALKKIYKDHCKKNKREIDTDAFLQEVRLALLDTGEDPRKTHLHYAKVAKALFPSEEDFSLPTAVLKIDGKELSGSVLDSDRKNLWSLGDSGTGNSIFRTEIKTGASEKTSLLSAKNIDWEAFTKTSQGDFLILDTGDNLAERIEVSVYQFRPNELPETKRIKIQYQGGPRDVEAGVATQTHLLLIEKNYITDAEVVALPLEFKNSNTRKIGKIPWIGAITDASQIDGITYLLTYTGVWECNKCWLPDQKPKQIFKRFLGQVETLVALEKNNFLIGREDGRFFQWKNGSFLNILELP